MKNIAITLHIIGYLLYYFGIDDSNAIKKTTFPPDYTEVVLAEPASMQHNGYSQTSPITEPEMVRLEQFSFWNRKGFYWTGWFGYSKELKHLVYSEIKE